MLSSVLTHEHEPKGHERTHLSKAPHESKKRESVCTVGIRKGSKDGELRADPDNSQPDAEGHLRSNICSARAVFVEDAQNAEPDDDESPADVVLGTITVDDLYGEPCGDSEGWNSQTEGEQVDTRPNRGGSLSRLEIDGKVIYRELSLIYRRAD